MNALIIKITVDAIMHYNDKYVFVTRGHEPFKGQLAFPGGHVDYGESCEVAAIREAKEETGLDFKIRGLLGVYSEPNRDPRGHYVTIVFFGEGSGQLKAGDDAKEVTLISVEDALRENLAFDHKEILQDYNNYCQNLREIQTDKVLKLSGGLNR
jgi:8-oxo-dGTP diphosphatase